MFIREAEKPANTAFPGLVVYREGERRDLFGGKACTKKVYPVSEKGASCVRFRLNVLPERYTKRRARRFPGNPAESQKYKILFFTLQMPVSCI